MQSLNVAESDLTSEQFAIVAAFADATLPALVMPEDGDIDELIASLAGTLKQPRTAMDAGKLKLAIYRRMLRGTPLRSLQLATRDALAELQWMPTPAELLALAKRRTSPEHMLHGKAQGLARARRQRLFVEAQRAIRDGTGNLSEMPAQAIRWGVSEGYLVQHEGGSAYRRPSVERPFARDEGVDNG